MADTDLAEGIDTTPLIEQLGKAFLELESQKKSTEDGKVMWKEIEEHFRHLETTMKKKFEELEVREKAFQEEKSNFHFLFSEREAAVAAKEQDMLDQIQELKDEAVAAIVEARTNHQPSSVSVGENKESKVSSSLGGENTNAPLFTPPEEEESPPETGKENAEDEVTPRPELTQLCEQMDAKGLLSFIIENRKNISAIREELPVALKSANEPGLLALASLEGFYPRNGVKKDNAALKGMRESCIVFLQAMATLLARANNHHLLNPKIKQKAKAISDEWKPKLADANGNTFETKAFLQLLATFKIASEFDEEELCKLVLAVAHHRQTPELCRSLGLTQKMPGVVEALINSGKQIDAARFVHAFKLTEAFPLVPLLKMYLKDLRRNSQGKGGAAGGQELAALRAVIECVKDYKLEVDYPLEPLQRRVDQLDKSKPDRKRFGESGKHQQQFKKSRANGGGSHGFRSPPPAAPHTAVSGGGRQALPVYGERGYAGLSERYPPVYNYQVPPSQSSAYAEPQGYEQRSYYYPPPHERVTTAATYNATPPPSSYGSYTAPPSSYGSYMSSGLLSSHKPYIM